MKYISIDLETTGLDPNVHNVLEFGAVVTDTQDITPLEALPCFQCYLHYDRVDGNPTALKMNAEVIKNIRTTPLTVDILDFESKVKNNSVSEIKVVPDNLLPWFKRWLTILGFENDEPIFVAGKNYNTFDQLFLQKLPGYKDIKWDYRTALDPGLLYLEADDKAIPSLADCLKRCDLESVVRHRALSDCFDVVKLIDCHFKLKRS